MASTNRNNLLPGNILVGATFIKRDNLLLEEYISRHVAGQRAAGGRGSLYVLLLIPASNSQLENGYPST